MNHQTVDHGKLQTRLYTFVFESDMRAGYSIIPLPNHSSIGHDADAVYCNKCGSPLKGGSNIQ